MLKAKFSDGLTHGKAVNQTMDAHALTGMVCREYVVEGVDRFCTGKYGQNHALGFMVGYVLSGVAVEAANGVNAYLARVSRKMEHLKPVDICEETPSWASQHARVKPPSLVHLHHIFLKLIDQTQIPKPFASAVDA